MDFISIVVCRSFPIALDGGVKSYITQNFVLVPARPKHSGPINMLSGSTAIFGAVGSISISSPRKL